MRLLVKCYDNKIVNLSRGTSIGSSTCSKPTKTKSQKTPKRPDINKEEQFSFYFFFNVGPHKEDIFYGCLLSPVFQFIITHYIYKLFFMCGMLLRFSCLLSCGLESSCLTCLTSWINYPCLAGQHPEVLVISLCICSLTAYTYI